jgi:hypothetical protein
LDLERRIRETRVEALVRSVGRTNGHGRGIGRLFKRNGRSWGRGGANGRPREDFAFDFRDRGDDFWRAFRR